MANPEEFDKLGSILAELGASLSYRDYIDSLGNDLSYVVRFTEGPIGSGCGSTPSEALRLAQIDRENWLSAPPCKRAA